jgi:hypothetical protein
LKLSVITLIFEGFRSLKIRLPRSIAGERSVYSEASKPVKYKTGSAKCTEMIAAPRLQSVFMAPVTGNCGDECEGTSKEFRREDSGDVRSKDGVELLGVVEYNLACARFNSEGIDMKEGVGLALSRTGSDC